MCKICSECGKTKEFASFYKKPRHSKYPDSAAGYSHQCIDCDKEARAEFVRLYPDKAKHSDRAYHLSKYGMTHSDYNKLFGSQDGKCLGCEKHQSEFSSRLVVDHDHSTGAVRGLLCVNCNSCIGQARDNVQVLHNLIGYLQKSRLVDNTKIVAFVTKKVG